MNKPIVNYKKDIIRHLSKASETGQANSEIFDDWLDLCLASLEALPSHIKNMQAELPLVDTPETQALFDRIGKKYRKPEYMQVFSKAFGLLVESTSTWTDTIGDVYMEFGIPNKYTGQFFTPWPVAKMMAQMTCMDIEKQVHDRIQQALKKSLIGQAYLIAGLGLEKEAEAQRWFLEKVLPEALPYYQPVTVCDPACGSGVMLLAAGSCCPRWMLDANLIQFYGVDIDMTCVKMARINCMLYSLNGYYLECALNLPDAHMENLPEPFKSAYGEAKKAKSWGNLDRVDQISIAVKTGTYIQTDLFQEVERI